MKNVPARNATRNLAEILTAFNATPGTPGRCGRWRNSLRSRLRLCNQRLCNNRYVSTEHHHYSGHDYHGSQLHPDLKLEDKCWTSSNSPFSLSLKDHASSLPNYFFQTSPPV